MPGDEDGPSKFHDDKNADPKQRPGSNVNGGENADKLVVGSPT